jgi:hypothetical protein
VLGRHAPIGDVAEEGRVQEIDVKVQDVEFIQPLYARGTKASLLRELQGGNTTIPAGDRGEQLIANLILSIIACHLHTVESARAHITQAHAIAEGLSRETLTHRPRRVSKLARLVARQTGKGKPCCCLSSTTF